jgi:hypothetical protein
MLPHGPRAKARGRVVAAQPAQLLGAFAALVVDDDLCAVDAGVVDLCGVDACVADLCVVDLCDVDVFPFVSLLLA